MFQFHKRFAAVVAVAALTACSGPKTTKDSMLTCDGVVTEVSQGEVSRIGLSHRGWIPGPPRIFTDKFWDVSVRCDDGTNFVRRFESKPEYFSQGTKVCVNAGDLYLNCRK